MLSWKYQLKYVTLIIILFILTSCATTLSQRSHQADQIATKSGFEKELVKTDSFVLTAYYRIDKKGAPLNLYIEGDGYAWITPSRVSPNPTPRNPVAFSLAAEDSAANVVYLARPCQYTPEEKDTPRDRFYWTKGRFSEPVINSMNEAVSYFVKKAGATGVHLIGYSGGAAVALLIAARRDDVMSIRTVAGNLDPEFVNRYHGVSPLEGSLNPLDYLDKIRKIPMRHFIGTDDKTIPASVARSFAERIGDKDHQSITEVKGADHTNGWRERWREIW